MNFLFPTVLIGLLAIAIPILIHLFNFRKFEVIEFPDIRFLKEIKERTNQSRSLKQILQLITRVLAITSLVLAFAQPYFGSKNDATNTALSIFIDNSPSMLLQNDAVSLLENSKKNARDIIQTLGNQDMIQVLSHDATNQSWNNKSDALKIIDGLKLSYQSKSIDEILATQKQSFSLVAQNSKKNIIISDFQKTPIRPKKNNDEGLLLVKRPQKNKNISIDSAWWENNRLQLNQNNKLYIKLTNHDKEEAATTTLSLYQQGQIKTAKEINLPNQKSELISLEYNTPVSGWQDLRLIIEDHPISFDDTLYLSTNLSPQLNILIATRGATNPYLQNAFKISKQHNLQFTNINSLSQSDLNKYNLVILDDLKECSSELYSKCLNYIQEGGSLFLIPSLDINKEDYNSTFGSSIGNMIIGIDQSKKNVQTINYDHSLIKEIFQTKRENIDLPVISKQLLFRSSSLNNEQRILGFNDGSSFLSSTRIGEGELFICSSPIHESCNNFMKSYLFLPALYNMVSSVSSQRTYTFNIGENYKALIDKNLISEGHLPVMRSGEIELTPNITTSTLGSFINCNSIRTAGNYSILQDDIIKSIISANYNRNESRLSYYALDELSNAYPGCKITSKEVDAFSYINKTSDNKLLNNWQWLLIIALLFLTLEIIISRLLK